MYNSFKFFLKSTQIWYKINLPVHFQGVINQPFGEIITYQYLRNNLIQLKGINAMIIKPMNNYRSKMCAKNHLEKRARKNWSDIINPLKRLPQPQQPSGCRMKVLVTFGV